MNREIRRLYFAYGSNLNVAQMLDRCPTAKAVTRHTMVDWKLIFRGYADIVPAVGNVVEGGLYEVGPKDVAALDRYEGVSAGFYSQVAFYLPNGSPAFFYRMNDGEIYPPDKKYVKIITAGFVDWNIPINSLEAAVTDALKSMANA